MIAQHLGFHCFVLPHHPQAALADMDLCSRCFDTPDNCGCWDEPDDSEGEDK